jgi:hypothetical protein
MYGGGVALLIHHSIPVTEITLPEVCRNVELVCVDINIYGAQYRVIVYYRRPYFQTDDISYFELSTQCLSDLLQHIRKSIIIMGDFNLPDMD